MHCLRVRKCPLLCSSGTPYIAYIYLSFMCNLGLFLASLVKNPSLKYVICPFRDIIVIKYTALKPVIRISMVVSRLTRSVRA